MSVFFIIFWGFSSEQSGNTGPTLDVVLYQVLRVGKQLC